MSNLIQTNEDVSKIHEAVNRNVVLFYILDPQVTLSFISHECFSLLGYTPKDFLFGNTQLSDLIYHEDVPKYQDLFENVCEPGRSQLIRWISHNGEIVHTKLSISPHYGVNHSNMIAIKGVLNLLDSSSECISNPLNHIANKKNYNDCDSKKLTDLSVEELINLPEENIINRNHLIIYDQVIEGWSRAMNLRDHDTLGHTLRVTNLTMRLARFLGIPQTEMLHIEWGSRLHDIGKLGIPDRILNKPGKLTDEEWVEMKKHPVYARELLKPADFLKAAITIPYYHHEKWDGSGYPEGLKGKEIPLSARIFAIVDVWDALLSNRPYRSAWKREKVIKYIEKESGKHFDPEIVSAFLLMIQDPFQRKNPAQRIA